ncbi:MAG: hypothetical protein QOF68_1847 [Gaiellales bacterium]|jgi:hypothetical protein|nr:hypothetical protein [Gaiellales bacterium]
MDALFFIVLVVALFYASVLLGGADSRTFDDRGWWPGKR